MVYRTTLDDPGRLAALERTETLDNIGDAPFERLVELARQLTQSDVALISMVGADRQTFVGQAGLPEPWATSRTTPLSHSFCQHVVRRADPLIVRDARQDPIVRDNAAVADLNVIAYVGVPLVTPDGYVIGSLCAIDGKPREWTDDDVNGLRTLAAQVLTEIALRSELKSRRAAEHTRDILFGELNHRVRNLFTLVLGLVRAVDADDASVRSFQDELATRIKALCLAHDLVFQDTLNDAALQASADVSVLADSILLPLPGSQRISRKGPKTRLSDRQSLYAALLFHELGTNALKHGALSVPDGRVHLQWKRVEDDLHIDWTEEGGPEPLSPTGRGFGIDLIEVLSASSKRPDKMLAFEPTGVICRTSLSST